MIEIWYYTSEVWSEIQADRYYYMLVDCCQELADNKLTGKKYLEVEKDILGFKVGQHIIYYKKLKSNNIEIARILHSRMDFKSRIEE